MNLKEQLTKDMQNARRNKETDKLNLLRLVVAEVQNAEIREKGNLSQVQVETILEKSVNQVKETLSFLEKDGTKQEEINKNNYWLSVLYGYLPEQLSTEEVKEMIDQIVTQNGYEGKKDMKHVMPALMPKIKGKFPGAEAKALVEAKLT